MGNNHSNNIQSLWKEQRSILVLPINANLEPLRVLIKQADGYHDVGNVISVSKSEIRQEGLKQALSSQVLLTKTLGKQPFTISGDQGAIAAKLIVGDTNAASWFQNAASINVSVPDCSIREFPMQIWEEMIQRFHPNTSGKQDLFIVQKVVLVSQIKITVRYNAPVDLDLDRELPLPSKGLKVESSYDRSTDTAKFIILSSKIKQKLPIAFSGFKYTYDKFGVRESKQTQVQHDLGGASSSDEEDDDEDDDEEDVAANDENMGDFIEDNGDWWTSISSSYDPNEYVIFAAVQEERDPSPEPALLPPPPPAPASPPRRDLEDID